MSTRDRRSRREASGYSWAGWLAALGLVLLLLGIGTLAAAAYTAARVPQPTELACCALFDTNRAPAQSVGFGVIANLAVFLDDATSTTLNALVAAFNTNGTWSTTFGNFQGTDAITTLLDEYYFSDYEFFVTNTVHDSAWDYTTSTLTVQYLHEAYTASERYMYNDSYTVVLYPSETPFAQDRVSVFKFDCAFRIVYMRTYFDNLQRVSTFTSDYPATCARCTGECVTQQTVQSASRAVHGAARQQAARNGVLRLAGTNYSEPRHRPPPEARRPQPVGVPSLPGIAV